MVNFKLYCSKESYLMGFIKILILGVEVKVVLQQLNLIFYVYILAGI